MLNFSALEETCDTGFGTLKIADGGDVYCVFALRLQFKFQPEIKAQGLSQSQTIQVSFSSVKLTSGGTLQVPDAFPDHQTTKQSYGTWSPLHLLCLEFWLYFQLVRVVNCSSQLREFAQARSRSFPTPSSIFDAEYSKLQSLVAVKGAPKTRPCLPPNTLTQFKKLQVVLFAPSPAALWVPAVSVEPVSHYVACVVCNRCPIVGRVFVCQTCSHTEMCMYCYRFHDVSHNLMVVGNDDKAYPLPEQVNVEAVDGAPGVLAQEANPINVNALPLAAASAPPIQEQKADVVYSIVSIPKGRFYQDQKQYYVNWSNYPSQWISRDQLLVGGGMWLLASPYDDLKYLTQQLDLVATPELLTSTEKSKVQRRAKMASRVKKQSAKRIRRAKDKKQQESPSPSVPMVSSPLPLSPGFKL